MLKRELSRRISAWAQANALNLNLNLIKARVYFRSSVPQFLVPAQLYIMHTNRNEQLQVAWDPKFKKNLTSVSTFSDLWRRPFSSIGSPASPKPISVNFRNSCLIAEKSRKKENWTLIGDLGSRSGRIRNPGSFRPLIENVKNEMSTINSCQIREIGCFQRKKRAVLLYKSSQFGFVIYNIDELTQPLWCVQYLRWT